MLQRLRPFLSTKVAAIVVVLGSLAAGAVAATSSSETTPPARATATVEYGNVSMGVTSSGSLTALSEQNLGFEKGGQLTSVAVRVGDHVEAGKELATIDDAPARQALAAARARLNAEEAALEKVDDSTSVDGAEDALSQAEDTLKAVRRQAEAQDNADQAAIDIARRQLDIDQAAAANARAHRDSACAISSSSPSCTSAQSDYLTAQQKVVTSQSLLTGAQQKRSVDRANGRVSIETAQQSVVSARNSVDTEDSIRPHSIDQQEALVDAARADVSEAQRVLDNTTLRAPVAGTITALNGAVGEYVSPSNGTSALAPGTDGSIPGASGSSSNSGSATSAAAAAQAAATPPRPGGSQFIVLSDIDQLQVVAPFNESDAAAIRPEQHVDVTFDALPDLKTSGSVVSVAPAGTAISGVVSYYVTVALDEDDASLKDGLTANVAVLTDERDDVLTVPSAAVRKVNGHSAVTVIEGDTSRTVTFDAGVVGLDRTEVVSGLREGQQVAIPVARRGGAQR
jgi:HlyD family secretion protein